MTIPQDGSSSVPVNVIPRVEYPATQAPGGRPAWTIFYGGGNQLEGTAHWDGETAWFEPNEPFAPDMTYYVRVTDQALGTYLEYHFSTRDTEDTAQPRFGGVTSVRWEHKDAEWLQSSCALWRGSGFVLTVRFDEARDDTPADQLAYYVYQTSGPGVDGEKAVARVLYDADGTQLFLSDEDGEADICYRVEVRDLAGNFDGNRHEACVEPVVNQAFHDACTVAPGRPATLPPMLLLAALAVALLRSKG